MTNAWTKDYLYGAFLLVAHIIAGLLKQWLTFRGKEHSHTM